MELGQSSTTVGTSCLINNIVEVIAEAENVDAIDLYPPLNEVIDPDALEQLLKSANTEVAVSFDYREWTVIVRGEDIIQVISHSNDT